MGQKRRVAGRRTETAAGDAQGCGAGDETRTSRGGTRDRHPETRGQRDKGPGTRSLDNGRTEVRWSHAGINGQSSGDQSLARDQPGPAGPGEGALLLPAVLCRLQPLAGN